GNYKSISFLVSIAGNYTFTMADNGSYDGMAYLYSGAFTPGTCATGTWIKGDDDSGPSDEPQFSAVLNTGVIYTLVSTSWGSTSGTYSGSFAWTIAPPSGGGLIVPNVQWYTTPTGGSPIGTGISFNPVGVAGSGLGNTNTSGTTTFYAACASAPDCRTATTFVINALPATPIGSITGTTPACGSTTLTYSAPAANIYWQSSATGVATANPTTTALPVTLSGNYYVRQYNGTCWSTASAPYAVVVNAQPVITTQPTSVVVNAPIAATFTVVATGTITGYQWEIFNGVSWENVPAAAPYAGTTTATLTVSPTDVSLSDNEYRCVIKGAGPCVDVISNVVTLTVNPGPCLSESFTSTSFPPAGWLVTNVTRSTNAGDYNSGPAAAIFGSTSGSITTALIANPSILQFYLGRSSNSTPKTLTVEISTTSQTNGFTTIATYDHTNVPSDSYNQYTINLSTYTGNNSVWVRFVKVSSTTSPWRLDDITFTCGSSCVPTQEITDFTPTSGPAGTLVTITGSGFTVSSTVKFGGIASGPLTFVNATTLVAEVPAGAVSGPISVTEASCDRVSAGSFTLLTANASCGVSGVPVSNGLIISEVFDSQVGTLSYVELYNPTVGGISLSDYSIRIATGSNSDYSLGTATVPSGGTLIVRLGNPNTNGSSVCGVTSSVTHNGAGGFNGNDQVILRLNGANHDVVNNPNFGSQNSDAYRGFSQLRNPGNTTPRSTYIPAEWTNSSTESCSHLGIAPAGVSNANITITSQPSDVSCNDPVTFSVAATGTPGISNYVW
ncbi:MAG: hypothetical protein EOP51_24260, partial [Sphingobacteriales bacterium]